MQVAAASASNPDPASEHSSTVGTPRAKLGQVTNVLVLVLALGALRNGLSCSFFRGFHQADEFFDHTGCRWH